jgi:hypothetical protein
MENFSLSNSGNDTAFNLVITPFILGVQSQQKTYSVNSLGPSSRINMSVSLTGIKQSGTYGGYFYAAYQQGTEVFTAVFPCLFSFFKQTQSLVIIKSVNTTFGANGNATVRISVFNEGPDTLKTSVYLVVPPSFSYNGTNHPSLDLAQYQTGNATFVGIKVPNGQAAYAAAAFANYSEGNLSYSSLLTFVISAPEQTPGKLSSVFFYLAVGAIVIVVILLLFSILRKKKKKESAVV